MELGEPEVEDLDVLVPGDEDVLGLEVAVDDALRVGGRQTFGDLDAVLHRPPDGHVALPKPLAQGAALEQLGHDEGDAVVLSDVVDGHDVGVIEGAGGAGLPFEPAEPGRIVEGGRGQHLDRHLPV